MEKNILYQEIIALLKKLIATESFSGNEQQATALVKQFLSDKNIPFEVVGNNIFSKNKFFDTTKATILLHSHLDTVKPNNGWTKNPFQPTEEQGKLFGLGSNDAGGALMSLLGAFLYFYKKSDLSYNIIFAAGAEEENSGKGGLELLLPQLPAIAFAIVGEPTGMQMAVAEKGLLVLDCVSYGKSGHAARNEGENAIYKALKDIWWFKSYEFPKVSNLLGPVKMTVTCVKAGEQHNVVPDKCSFTVDIRVNEKYTNEELVRIIKSNVDCEVTPRSLRLASTSIHTEHPLVQAGIKMGKTMYGSPTLSDKALMPFPALKMGPGDSARSHTADEFIYLDEIKNGLNDYITLLDTVFKEETVLI